MDLSQTKLSKSEWMSVEVPVSDDEKRVIEMIMAGFANPNICENDTTTLASLMKIEINESFEYYLYTEYFDEVIRPLCSAKNTKLNDWHTTLRGIKHKSPNKADMIRMANIRASIQTRRNNVFEYVLVDFCMGVFGKMTESRKPVGYYLYSLLQFTQISVFAKINKYVREFVELVISTVDPTETKKNISHVVINAYEYIEKNPHLIRFEDRTLYSHQRTLFRAIDTNPHIAKLVLYMAPTGTGKTLSPLGISQKYRVIFVCVARHVGLALAKSAISVGKRVAFAFGCETASDIRLHYYSAKDYRINKRSGGIGKVDNSNGSKVEIMICDVSSYIVAMHYMLAFNNVSKLITFWDEPTITMDKPDDPLHELIHRNWSENRIPKMVLSCATLPKLNEIGQTINDFKIRFQSVQYDDEEEEKEAVESYPPEIITIDSYECKKTITLLSKDSKCVLPHLLYENYRDILRCVEHCKSNKTLLRYFDVREVVRLISYLMDIGRLPLLPEDYFKDMQSISMTSLKQYYLKMLEEFEPDKWANIYTYMVNSLPVYFDQAPASSFRKIQSVDSANMSSKSGAPIQRVLSVSPALPKQDDRILLTTKDAHTLTDGPAIFLAEDVVKIGRFYLQTANIPASVFTSILTKIEQNNQLLHRIGILDKELADKTGQGNNDGKNDKEHRRKLAREPTDKETQRLMDQLAMMREQISSVSIHPMYIPNTKPHQNIWLPADKPPATNAFVPSIGEEDVRDIMRTTVDNERKLLLILGIGVFAQNNDTQYAEIMKRLAYEQRLFLIIATSDYIYGTNYQFCHGFIGKDLANMTQQKTIQAIGRIGRNNIQNEYTVRFRDDSIIRQLFQKIDQNVEAQVMSRLFNV